MLVLGLAVVAAAVVAGARADGRGAVGANVNISKQVGNQVEVGIALNPTNTQQLWAGWNGSTQHKRSTDGGATWVAAPLTLPHGFCCDTQTAWDEHGNLFVTYIDNAPGFGPFRIMLEWSQNGGASFAPVPGLSPIPEETGTVDAANVDQPTVAVGANSVWVTWNDGTIKVRGAEVTGLGAIGTWTPEEHPPGADGQFGDIAIGPTGQVTVVSQDDVGSANTGTSNILVNTDPDGFGPAPFGPAVIATTTNVSTFDFVPPQDNRSIDAEADLEYDRRLPPAGGAFSGRLYLVYTDETVNENNDTNIHLRFSTDQGATWSAPVKLNGDATTRTQMLPNVHLDQTSGRLGVSWHDARNDPNNNLTEFWGTFVAPGGATFEANFKISAGVSNDDVAEPGGGIDYGDYTWGDFHNGSYHPAWADDSNSTGDNPDGATRFDIYTARVTPGPTALTVIDLFARRSVRGRVVVTWRTANERDVLGFDLFRTAAGRTVRVNRALIRARASGRAAGEVYRIVDRSVGRQATPTYRLRVLGHDGARWWQGTTGVATG
ncbi:MAG: hypothetical protein ABR521_12020 [Gaiellaceae bacterium]